MNKSHSKQASRRKHQTRGNIPKAHSPQSRTGFRKGQWPFAGAGQRPAGVWGKTPEVQSKKRAQSSRPTRKARARRAAETNFPHQHTNSSPKEKTLPLPNQRRRKIQFQIQQHPNQQQPERRYQDARPPDATCQVLLQRNGFWELPLCRLVACHAGRTNFPHQHTKPFQKEKTLPLPNQRRREIQLQIQQQPERRYQDARPPDATCQVLLQRNGSWELPLCRLVTCHAGRNMVSATLRARALLVLGRGLSALFLVAPLGFYPRPQQGAALHPRRAVGPLDTHFAIGLSALLGCFRVLVVFCALWAVSLPFPSLFIVEGASPGWVTLLLPFYMDSFSSTMRFSTCSAFC